MTISYVSNPPDTQVDFSDSNLQVLVTDPGNTLWIAFDLYVALPGSGMVHVYTRTGNNTGSGLNGWTFDNIGEAPDSYSVVVFPPLGHGFPVGVTHWHVATTNNQSGTVDSPDFTFETQHQLPFVTLNPVDFATGLAIGASITLDVLCLGTTVIDDVQIVENFPNTDPGNVWHWDTVSQTTASRFTPSGQSLSVTHAHVVITPNSPLWTPGTQIPLQVYVQWSDATGSGVVQPLWRFTTNGQAPPPPAHPIFITVTPDQGATGVDPSTPIVLDLIIPDDGETTFRSVTPMNVDGDSPSASYTLGGGYVLSSGYTQQGSPTLQPRHFHTSFSKDLGWQSDPTPFAYTPASEKVAYPDLGVSTAIFHPYQGFFANTGFAPTGPEFPTLLIDNRLPADTSTNVPVSTGIQFTAEVGSVSVPGAVFYEFQIDVDLGGGPFTAVHWVAGNVTVAAGYTALITADNRPPTFDVVLHKNGDWPYGTLITWTSTCKAFDCLYDASGSYEDTATQTFTTETAPVGPYFTYSTLLPSNGTLAFGQFDAIRVIGHTNPASTINNSTITVDGTVVYSRDNIGNVTIDPAWQHTSSNTTTITDTTLSPIDGFIPGTDHVWSVHTNVTDGVTPTDFDTGDLDFSIEAPRLEYLLISPPDTATDQDQHVAIHVVADTTGPFYIHQIELRVGGTLIYVWTAGVVSTNDTGFANSLSVSPTNGTASSMDLQSALLEFWPDSATIHWVLDVFVIVPGHPDNYQKFTLDQTFTTGTNGPVYFADPIDPENGLEGIATDFTIIVFGQFDGEPGTFLTRNVLVDSVPIYQKAGSSSPTVNPAWTVLSDFSSSTHFDVHLRRNTPYPFDTEVDVQTHVQVQNGSTVDFDDESVFTTITDHPIDVLAFKPEPNELNVSSTVPIVIVFTINIGFSLTHIQVYIGDVLAFADGIFSTPDFSGEYKNVDNFQSILINHRQAFPNGTTIPVRLVVHYNPGDADFVKEYIFHTFVPPPTLLDPSLQKTQIDQPFPDALPGLEVLRSRLLSAFALRPEASTTVQLYYRAYYSPLRAIADSFQLPASINTEVRRILPEDVGDANQALAVLDILEVVWPEVLRDLEQLGTTIYELKLLDQMFHGPYPQDRLAAASAALLLGAAKV